MNTQPTGYPPLSPAIAVKNTAQAIEFYQAAFGAVELFRLTDPGSGKVAHAEITIQGSLIMLGEENPVWNQGPESAVGSTVRLCLMVADTDAAVNRAQAAGAVVLRPPANQFYGHRCARVRDPFGREWMLSQEIEKVAPDEMQRRWNALAQSQA